MLGVEPLSMEWFNTPALRLEAASRVSRGAACEAELIDLVRQGLDDRLPPLAQETVEFRGKIISDLFTAVDGASAARVADAVLATIDAARREQPGSCGTPVAIRTRPAGAGRSPHARPQDELGIAPRLRLVGKRTAPAWQGVRA